VTDATIHIIDDDASMRTALARLFGAHGYATREYASAGDFLLDLPGDAPGCVVLDLSLPGPSGLDLQEAMNRRALALPVVFLTGRGDIASGVRAMKYGAVDFLTKPADPAALLDAVARALARDAASRHARALQRSVQERFDTLTHRERDVFFGVVGGRLNKQIAADLGISERTVKMHRGQVMSKMQVPSVANLVIACEILGVSTRGDAPPGAPDAAPPSVPKYR
jgi:FixJ family two-component response regulator